jgi:uncharacterized protein (UPF0335 family)
MRKRPQKQYNVAELQPDEVNALRALVKEFVLKIESVDNEIELLKTDRKEIIEEYAEKLDLKVLQAAMKVVKIQQSVNHRDTFDLFLEVLDPTTESSEP